MIAVRSIGKIDPASNNKVGKTDSNHSKVSNEDMYTLYQTAAALTEAVGNALGVPASRVFMNFDDIARTNWAMVGNTF